MTSETIIFTEEERDVLCTESLCKEHGKGTSKCPIPRTKSEAEEQLSEDDTNRSSLQEHAEPKTATGNVVRSK